MLFIKFAMEDKNNKSVLRRIRRLLSSPQDTTGESALELNTDAAPENAVDTSTSRSYPSVNSEWGTSNLTSEDAFIRCVREFLTNEVLDKWQLEIRTSVRDASVTAAQDFIYNEMVQSGNPVIKLDIGTSDEMSDKEEQGILWKLALGVKDHVSETAWRNFEENLKSAYQINISIEASNNAEVVAPLTFDEKVDLPSHFNFRIKKSLQMLWGRLTKRVLIAVYDSYGRMASSPPTNSFYNDLLETLHLYHDDVRIIILVRTANLDEVVISPHKRLAFLGDVFEISDLVEVDLTDLVVAATRYAEPTASDILALAQEDLILGLYALTLPYCIASVARLNQICNSLTKKGSRELATLTYAVGSRYVLGGQGAFDLTSAVREMRENWTMSNEQLLEAVDHFFWQTENALLENAFKNKFAPIHLDRLIFVRTLMAVSDVRHILSTTYRYLTQEVAVRYEQELPLATIGTVRNDILTILTSGTEPYEQSSRIERAVKNRSSQALRSLGFISAESLLSVDKETRLRPCSPIQAELSSTERNGTYWPASADIAGGTVVRTNSYSRLRDALEENRTVLLHGFQDCGKSICARLLAYDCMREGKTVLYFGLKPDEELSDLLDRYSKIDTNALGNALQALDNPDTYIILDDIHLSPNLIGELIADWKYNLKEVHIILISLGVSSFLADEDEDFLRIPRVMVSMTQHDVNELVKIYYPSHRNKLGKSPISIEINSLRDLRLSSQVLQHLIKLSSSDWLWLHTYLEMLKEQPFYEMIEGNLPRLGRRRVNEVFARDIETLPSLTRKLFLEVCALSQMGIIMLHSPYFEKDTQYTEAIDYLVNQGLVVRVRKVKIRETYALGVDFGEVDLRAKRSRRKLATANAVGYKIQERALAKHYLDNAERRNWLELWDERSIENAGPRFLPADGFRSQTLARYLICKPANYVHVLYFAIVNKQHRVLRRAFHTSQQWTSALRSSITDLMHREDSPLTFALCIRLLRLVRRDIPSNILKSFEDEELKHNAIQVDHLLNDEIQVRELTLSLKYLRIGSRVEARSFINKRYIIRVQSVADRFLDENSDLRVLSALVLELYKLDRRQGREIVEAIALDNLVPLIEKRIDEARRPGDLHEPATMLKIMSLIDHKRALQVLESMNNQSFVERLSWRVDPVVFSQVMSILGSISLASVRSLFDMGRSEGRIGEALIKGFSPRYMTFSQSMYTLSQIAELDRYFAYYIFDYVPIEFWIDKWNYNSVVSELIAGLEVLHGFNRKGAHSWVVNIEYEEWMTIFRRSLESPYNSSNLLYVLSQIDPELALKIIGSFDLFVDVIPVFEFGNNRDPSVVASLFVSLTQLEGYSERLRECWRRMNDKDIWLLLEDPNVNKFAFANFFRYLKNAFFEMDRFPEIRADIEMLAARIISGDTIDHIVAEENSLAILAAVIDGLGNWVPEIALEGLLVRYSDQFEYALKHCDDISDIGRYVHTICKNVPGMHQTLFEQLDWSLIEDEIIIEFKLTRVAHLLSGLSRLSSSTISEHVDNEPTGLSLENKLSKIEHELVERMRDEHDIITLDRLIDALARGMPEMASRIVRRLDFESLIDICYAEPRVEEVGRFVYSVFSANNEFGGRLIDALSADVRELRHRVFNIPHLGYLGFHLRRFHNPFHTTLRFTTARQILDTSTFDNYEELIRRIENEASSSKVACLLHHLRQISPDATLKMLELSRFDVLNKRIELQHKALAPEYIALLFVLRDIEQIGDQFEKSEQLADKLLGMDIIREMNRTNNLVLASAALRELRRTVDNPAVIYDELDTELWINKFIYEYETRRKLQQWELGWCLWAICDTARPSKVDCQIRRQIMKHIPPVDLLKSMESTKQLNKAWLAFMTLGFWPYDDPTYLSAWRSVVRQTLLDWKNPVVLLCHEFEGDSDLKDDIGRLQIAPMGEDPERQLSALLWTMYWRWFRLYEFPG